MKKPQFNPVAKHSHKFNRASVVESKKVYNRREKHKGRESGLSFCLTI